MAAKSSIAWTKSTFNPWIGCQKVGPGCDNCYAEALDARKVFQGQTHFGPRVPRMRTSTGNWNQVRRWNRQAPGSEFAGQKDFWPVFCASLADIFDKEVDPAWRADFWRLVKECGNLTFLVLTKRIGNVPKMLPPDWGLGYPNVWLGATIVNQDEADRDVPKLLAVPATKRFLSMEPLLGPVDLAPAWLETCDCIGTPKPALDWIIVGGESTDAARPMHPEWVQSLRGQCDMPDVPFIFKQWGEWRPAPEIIEASHGALFHRFHDGVWVQKYGTKDSGCALNGAEIKQWPKAT